MVTDKHHHAPVEKPVSREDRVKALLDGYWHGMECAAPRNPTEFKELMDLLGVKHTK